MDTQPTGKNGYGFPTGSTMADGLTDMATDKAPHIGAMLRQRMFQIFRINTKGQTLHVHHNQQESRHEHPRVATTGATA
jgi:hypothetical protein